MSPRKGQENEKKRNNGVQQQGDHTGAVGGDGRTVPGHLQNRTAWKQFFPSGVRLVQCRVYGRKHNRCFCKID